MIDKNDPLRQRPYLGTIASEMSTRNETYQPSGICLFSWIVFPVEEATKASRYKLVRATGAAVTYTVMLPWTVASFLVIGTFMFFAYILSELFDMQ